jgi:hypothetical protein
MKTLFVSLVALLFAFFLGCQSSITDPVSSESTKYTSNLQEETAAYKDAFNSKYPNMLKLQGTLVDPSHRPNGYADISGVVRYGFKELKGGMVPVNAPEFYKTAPSGTPDKKFRVDLYVDADLKGGCVGHNNWSVKKAAEQTIIISSSRLSVISIQKSFRVKNTCCAPLDLFVKFEVSNKELKIVSMELKIVEGWERITAEE